MPLRMMSEKLVIVLVGIRSLWFIFVINLLLAWVGRGQFQVFAHKFCRGPTGLSKVALVSVPFSPSNAQLPL